MRTADEHPICPYTGLRSFTEEESLYFKGRDLQVDQITALLEENKFLMVTGASGEGKSSLIYAGLIPNARAGFFKARYSNWVIADFRPERNPVKNMSIALADKFGSSPSTVETELRRGFSSLIDLYTNSPFYLVEEEIESGENYGQEAKDRKRKAANLMIIVDQFEEFFTNPENFFNEILSKDSQIVVNLILETARIAIRQNLPVYVVCTMRSDYIGQCSAFRGLPEYIGFSQFFVPRLKRKDLKQVIEEPALLSGISISQRLIERLVFDISEGVDQLPILQHALSRVWTMADQGREKLDLIHYAMVGGMSVEELPDEDVERFRNWFDALPERQRIFYQHTGLSRIIEIHANLLYENAWEYYNSRHPESSISQQEAKRIVAIGFSCLTKIDNSRAVRNRMSLEEITAIINQPGLDTGVVGGVLNIFREEGNSFIRPFITEDSSTLSLKPDTVLDITHESLIRNWDKLNQWANKEFEFYSTFLDFQKQLDRWKKSGKSRGYLLPLGPLSYFENWYKNCRPNVGWIMRYAETQEDYALRKEHSELVLGDTREFLKRSARKEMVTRAFMKYGPQRIATVFAIMVMLVLSVFYGYNADQKRNGRVIEKVKAESRELLKSEEVNLSSKAIYLLTEERQDSGTILPYLESLDYKARISLANEVYKQILAFDKQKEGVLKRSVTELIAKNLDVSAPAQDPEFMLEETNKFLILLVMDQYYGPDPQKEIWLASLAARDYQHALRFFNNRSLFHPVAPSELNMAVQLWLTVGKARTEEIRNILHAFSPLEGGKADSAFKVYYRKGSFESDGRMLMDFNGGYHTLASLYAAMGDMEHVVWCFNSMLENNLHDYFELPRILNNHLNILGYFYQYGHRDKVPELLQWLDGHTVDNKPATILRNAVLRSGYISHLYLINVNPNYYRSIRGYLFPNLCLSERAVFDAMEEDYEKVLNGIEDPDARRFALALNLKRKAMFYAKYWFDRKIPNDEQRLNAWLNQSLVLSGQLDKGFLEGTESSTLIYNGDGVRTSDVKRRDLLNYPDYRDGWFSWTFHTDYYFNFLKKNGLLQSVYKTGADLQLLHYWIAKAFEWKTDISQPEYSHGFILSDDVLKDILAFVGQHPEGSVFDRNLLYLVLANRAFGRGDNTLGFQYYTELDLKNIIRSSDRYEYLEKSFVLNMMKELCGNLAAMGKDEESIRLAMQFTTEEERMFCYERMAEKVYKQNPSPEVFRFLDSVYSTSKKIDYTNLDLRVDCRINQIKVLSEIGSKALNNSADDILVDIPQSTRFDGLVARVSGIASEGSYYRALSSIPKTLTETEDLTCHTKILLEECRAKERLSNDKRWAAFDQYLDWETNYINFIPN